MKGWTHKALVEDLLRSRLGIGEAVVTEMGLGAFSSGGFVDVASFRLSWKQPCMKGWEVKVTRRNYLDDLQAQKWKRYLPYLDRFYFAAPLGLLKKGEIPEGAGLIVRGETGWHAVKASALPERDWPARAHGFHAFLMALHPGPWTEDPFTKATKVRYELLEQRRREVRRLGRETAFLVAGRHALAPARTGAQTPEEGEAE